MLPTSSLLTPDLLASALTYERYITLSTDLLARGRSTSADPHYNTPEILGYTKLNLARMHRLEKQTVVRPDLAEAVERAVGCWTWLVLTESWCGDAAQSVPVLRAVAGKSIDFRLVLRDENPELMNAYLTNGGRSIPKLISINTATRAVLGTWGPRPAELQRQVMEWRAEGKLPYSEIVERAQRWYNTDQTESLQAELLQLVRRWSLVN